MNLDKIREAMGYVRLQSNCDYNNDDVLQQAVDYFYHVVAAIEANVEPPNPPLRITIHPF